MSSLNKSSFVKVFLSYLPLIFLFISVFNEFDFNYLRIENFSFNFVHILIFYWTLRNPNHLNYISIFLAGLINDAVIGIPMGISSFCYLLICSVTAYIRNITLSPSFINDWLSFLFIILLINSNEMIVYTSGLGGLFKPGMPVGKINSDIKNDIVFFSDFSQLDYVKVVSYIIGSNK